MARMQINLDSICTLESDAEKSIYRESITAALDDPRIKSRIGTRPGVTTEAVHAAMASQANIRRSLRPCLESQLSYRTAQSRFQNLIDLRHETESSLSRNWRSSALFGCSTAVAAAWIFNWFNTWAWLVMGTVYAIITFLTMFNLTARANFTNRTGLIVLRPLNALIGLHAGAKAKKWSHELQRNGTGPVVSRVTEALLGDDPDSLLLPDNYIEMREKTQLIELQDIARRTISKELIETLAGFKTLLSAETWQTEKSGIMRSLRYVMGHLRSLHYGDQQVSTCFLCERNLELAIQAFVSFSPHGRQDHRASPESVHQLLHEAAAYSAFSLTLLQIFGTEGFGRRSRSAIERSTDGQHDLLAEARRELETSPHSTLEVLEAIRIAWELPPLTVIEVNSLIPPPRRGGCPHH